ncbi:MAG: hypothetical protein ACD_4C00206G0002 [uncultured bacterium (gcode 4)]|uniref:Uncharacterized protein n=1 Tax=uncultured bacterium (gcode 4) TaxID=1234023 RepID=K2G964_9BACT|nr:MAG: hypothetical protein ACD_4C00206G0002 [uncultured bacterium (gcode 4)]
MKNKIKYQKSYFLLKTMDHMERIWWKDNAFYQIVKAQNLLYHLSNNCSKCRICLHITQQRCINALEIEKEKSVLK